MAELIKSRGSSYLLHLDGFLYYKNGGTFGQRAYWICKKKPECSARAVTVGGPQDVHVVKGTINDHQHAPDIDAVEAVKVVSSIKRKAEAHPEAPPAQILRTALKDVPSGILSQLPDRINLRKGISRLRLKTMPSNTTSIDQLQEVAQTYRQTLSGEQFLMYDSFEDEDDDYEGGRILILCTVENLRQLFRSTTWFVDGTFKSAPTIFFQLFAIMGAVKQVTARGDTQIVGLPFVYALLENKEERSYLKVFEVVMQSARDNGIRARLPATIMSDFELFHLGQNLFRHVQDEGLQERYVNKEDSSIRDATHQLLALAFVPSQDIQKTFKSLARDIPADFKPVYKYFGKTYVIGSVSKTKRRIQPRYKPALRCQYNAVMQQTARTNNVSEGWHNRLRVVMGRDHPSIYAFLTEIKKEQADTEILLRQLQLGQRVRRGQDPQRKRKEEKIFALVSQYDDYVENYDILNYLKAVGRVVRL